MPLRSYPAFSLQVLSPNVRKPFRQGPDRWQTRSRISPNLSIMTVNRKVDGTFTDLTLKTESLG
jgi:hypothetical protein